jgi:hypothetical protein
MIHPFEGRWEGIVSKRLGAALQLRPVARLA